MKRILLLFLTCLLIMKSFSQKILEGFDAGKIVKNSNFVYLGKERNDVRMVVFDEKIYQDGEFNLKELLGISNEIELRVYSEKIDKYNKTHIVYHQYYKNIPVEYGVLNVHKNKEKIESITCNYYKTISCNTQQNDDIKSQWVEIEQRLQQYYNSKLKVELEAVSKVIYPKAEKFYLAYKVEIHIGNLHEQVYIDIETKQILHANTLKYNCTHTGQAETRYYGLQSLQTEQDSCFKDYWLFDSSRGNGIFTIDLSNYPASTAFYIDADNYWDDTTNLVNGAYDLHWGLQKTYDYYLNTYNLASFDGSNHIVIAAYGIPMVNAEWNFGNSSMLFGIGGVLQGFYSDPLTSLDIVGHEFTHGVTQYSSNLQYYGESGALNESFSDIFGITIEKEIVPNSDYIIGNLINFPIRDMSNPNASGYIPCPDTYNGLFWSANPIDVHTNSGVQNYWYYLLAEGGSGTNDLGNYYNINGVGIKTAQDIAYQNNAYYLTNLSNYFDAYIYSSQLTASIYGVCSNEHNAVIDAWYAVGFDLLSNQTDFSTNYNGIEYPFYYIDMPISFVDLSLYPITSWNWAFGDNIFSNIQNPTYTYSTAGIYNACLNVSNGCITANKCEDIVICSNDNYSDYSNNTNNVNPNIVDIEASIINPYRIKLVNGQYLMNRGYLCGKGDEDYFLIRLYNNPCIQSIIRNITIQLSNSEQDYDIEILYNGSVVQGSYNIGNIPDIINYSSAYLGQDHYIRIFPKDSSNWSLSDPYQLSIIDHSYDPSPCPTINPIISLRCYPNPTDKYLKYSVEFMDDITKIRSIQVFITSIKGEKIEEKTIGNYQLNENQFNDIMDVHNLIAGKYYLNINIDGQTKVVQFLKK